MFTYHCHTWFLPRLTCPSFPPTVQLNSTFPLSHLSVWYLDSKFVENRNIWTTYLSLMSSELWQKIRQRKRWRCRQDELFHVKQVWNMTQFHEIATASLIPKTWKQIAILDDSVGLECLLQKTVDFSASLCQWGQWHSSLHFPLCITWSDSNCLLLSLQNRANEKSYPGLRHLGVPNMFYLVLWEVLFLAMKDYNTEALKQYCIRPSTSPVASSVFFEGKNNEGLRPCIDYRPLNTNTVKYPYLINILKQLRGATVFKLDLQSAYNLQDEDCLHHTHCPLRIPVSSAAHHLPVPVFW